MGTGASRLCEMPGFEAKKAPGVPHVSALPPAATEQAAAKGQGPTTAAGSPAVGAPPAAAGRGSSSTPAAPPAAAPVVSDEEKARLEKEAQRVGSIETSAMPKAFECVQERRKERKRRSQMQKPAEPDKGGEAQCSIDLMRA
jgi:hypothetical protein